MKCPRCSNESETVGSACERCGLDYSVLAALDDLRRAVGEARTESESTAGRLRRLEERMLALEPQIYHQITATESPKKEVLPAVESFTPPVEESTIDELTEGKSTADDSAVEESTEAPVESEFVARVTEALEPQQQSAQKPNTPTPSIPTPSVEARTPYRASGGSDIANEPHLASMLLRRRGPSTQKEESPAKAVADWGEIQLGQKWLLIAGLAITVLAVGYFLKYSFDRNWIGPTARVALAYLTGVGMLGLGEFCRRRKFDVFGLYVIGGGIAVLYFASYAAFQIYHLFGQTPAFALMALVTGLAGWLSLYYDTMWLAVLGIIGGFLTPIVLSTGTDNQIALMTYIAILNGGILAIATSKQWNLLNYLGLTLTWLLFATWHFKYYDASKFWATTLFLNIFFLTYALIPFIYYFVRTERRDLVGFTITVPNAFTAFGYSFAMIRERFSLEAVSIVSISYAVLFFAMAAYLYKRNRESIDAIVLLLAKGLLFLVITVPILFSEHWITVFWTVQGGVLMWAAARLSNARLRNGALLLVSMGIAKFLLHDYVNVFRLSVLSMKFKEQYGSMLVERWIATAVVLGTTFFSAWLLGLKKPNEEQQSDSDDRENDGDIWNILGERKSKRAWRDWAGIFYGVFGSLLFVVANIEVITYFNESAPRAVFATISVLWALFAAALMVLGFVRNLSILRRCAILLFAVTIIKVFAHDMANVDTPFRILSSLVLGLMLVGASYLYHRFTTRILDDEADTVDVESM